MKTGFLLLIAMLLFFLCASTQEIRKEDILQHGISSITYIDSPGTASIEVYNDQGDLIRRTFSFEGKTYTTNIEYEYNDSFQVVRSIHFLNGKNQNTSVYSYANGLLHRVETTHSSSPASVKAMEYDKRGNKIKEVYSVKGIPPFKTVQYTYNEQNQVTRELTTDHHTRKKTEKVFTYNTKGQLIKTQIALTSSQVHTTTHAYDDSGRVIARTDSSPEGNEATATYTYDSNGLLAGIDMKGLVTVKEKKTPIRYKTTIVVSTGAARKAERMLYVIDSVPVLKDPEPWNPVVQEDWADMRVIRDKDSIQVSGWQQVDAITYIFTKAYRSRPDSLKKIPGLRHLVQKDGAWHLHDTPYTGKYLDYYNSGRIMNEGTMENGRLHGPFIVYYPDGHKKSFAHYKEGVLHGVWNDYYPNGALMLSKNFGEGKSSEARKEYFINGQLQFERRVSGQTPYDTAVAYYSTGKIKQMTLFQEGKMLYNRKAEDLRTYTNDFYRGLKVGDLKEANKAYFQLWKIDSGSADTYFKGGLLMLKELRFKEAVVEFDRALGVEPLMPDAFAYRALARLKQHKFASIMPATRNFKEPPLALSDLTSLPPEEQARVCKDLQQARALNFEERALYDLFPYPILEHCPGRK